MGTRVFVALVVLLAVAGCSQEVPSIPQEQAAVPAEPGAAPADVLSFSMTPDSIRACDAGDGEIASIAKWDVAAQGIREVSIYVVDVEGERKLWLSAGAKGEAATGKWVFPRSRFQLVDRESGKSLSEVEIQSTPCP